MVALELVPGASFDPAAFDAWLAAQPDLGTKWIPRFVRVAPVLPQTATGKLTKVGLRQEAWICADPVWWKPPGASDYRPLSGDDRTALAAALSDHGRPPLEVPDPS
jgi:fatty-acyl-CoA synthase